MSMNIASVMSGSMCLNGVIDAEHLRIMRELRAMGIEPTGDKSADKAKLEEAKKVKSIEQANISKNKSGEEQNAQTSVAINENQQAETNAAMTGATQLSELNKLFLLKKAV